MRAGRYCVALRSIAEVTARANAPGWRVATDLFATVAPASQSARWQKKQPERTRRVDSAVFGLAFWENLPPPRRAAGTRISNRKTFVPHRTPYRQHSVLNAAGSIQAFCINMLSPVCRSFPRFPAPPDRRASFLRCCRISRAAAPAARR